MTPFQVVCQPRETQEDRTAGEGDGVPLIEPTPQRRSDGESERCSAGNLGGDLIALGNPGGFGIGGDWFAVPGTANGGCGPYN